ncbi:MAG: zinc metallopeptidase [Verrucomicrobiales bacterium]|nr:zinc metallopeptidase [Verrucomicrobiales bacterium]
MPLALIILAVVVLLSVIAGRHAIQRASAALSRAHQQAAPGGLTGREVAERYLREQGLTDVEVLTHRGVVTDYFDPRRRRLFLSKRVADQATLAAWAVALHEAAHASQTGSALGDLKWRQSCIRMCRYGPTLVALLLAVATVMKVMPARIAILAFGVLWVIFFLLNAGTLAIEWNATQRLRPFLDHLLQAHPHEREELDRALATMATRELGDQLASPRYFFLSALPGTTTLRPRSVPEEKKDPKPNSH